MKTKIGILGLGGVGGYFGGLLAKTYFKSDEVEIIFIARGETFNLCRISSVISPFVEMTNCIKKSEKYFK